MPSVTTAAIRRTRGDAPSLLWIDDEVQPSSAEVQLLGLEGVLVDCSPTGAAGLAMARNKNYEAILLDLHLPDIPGLAVLATLRTESIDTPVLVLTGFADIDSAVAAGRLGASGFKTKPLFIDDLKEAVRQIIAGQYVTNPETYKALSVDCRALCSSIGALLEGLHSLSRRDPLPDRMSAALYQSPRGAQSRSEKHLVRLLGRSLANVGLPMPVFLAGATALKRTLGADSGAISSAPADAEQYILEILGRPAPSDPRVVAALRMPESAANQCKRLRAAEIAAMQNVDASHLGRLISEETGFGLSDWRTGFLLRPSLQVLAETNEHVKQIACRLLGFKYQAQFAEEFHRFFGLTPTEFRRLFRNT